MNGPVLRLVAGVLAAAVAVAPGLPLGTGPTDLRIAAGRGVGHPDTTAPDTTAFVAPASVSRPAAAGPLTSAASQASVAPPASTAPLASATPPASTAPTATADDDPGPDAPGPAPGLRQRQGCVPAPDRTSAAAVSGRGDPLADVHRLADGTGQRIAVIDTGVTPNAGLGKRLIGGGDYLAGGDGLSDCDGHGTEVAGLLAAAPDTGTRSGAGVAPKAEVLALRQSSGRFTVTGPDGRERPAGEIGTLAAAITRAVALGATVVNISEVVCVPADQAVTAGRPLERAVRGATDAGVVVVAAAGNIDPSGTCTGAPDLRPLPALFDGVLAVGAVDDTDRPAEFSVPGDWVDVAAPGVDVRPSTSGTGALLSGTSYATPVVAGVAALLRERFPSLTPDQVADRIRATARHPARGHDDRVGYGVVDPMAALTAEPLLLGPTSDRAGAEVTGPFTGSGPTGPDTARSARLPGIGEPRPDHTLAAVGGMLAVLALTATTLGLLRRLRLSAAPPRHDRRGHRPP